MAVMRGHSEYGGLVMNRTFHTHFVILLTIIICVFIHIGCTSRDRQATDETSLKEFGKIIEQRPAPDLERLAERSAPGNEGKDATEAFYDILKLRDVGNAKAIPVLEKILSDHTNSTRIHGYAAAQALFCIGTPEAHRILSKYLLNKNYFAGLSINYIYYWEMDKSKRDSFIEQYHLKNISQDMTIKISARSVGQQLIFTVTLTNTSKEPYRILDKRIHLGEMVFFESKNGRYFDGSMYAIPGYGAEWPNWIVLKPGEPHQYNIVMEVSANTNKSAISEKDEHVALILRTDDFVYGLDKPGEFKVYAMYENQPISKEYLEKMDFDNPWSGRAVSEPIVVNIDVE
jgi:hypothetical protein